MAVRAVFDALPTAVTPLPAPTSAVATALGCRLFNLVRWEKVSLLFNFMGGDQIHFAPVDPLLFSFSYDIPAIFVSSREKCVMAANTRCSVTRSRD